MTTMTAPDRTEAAEYYFIYIDQVPAGDICTILAAQLTETVALLDDISDEQSLFRVRARQVERPPGRQPFERHGTIVGLPRLVVRPRL